jgi:RNA 3'-terminal phosphate cyclase (ATP)
MQRNMTISADSGAASTLLIFQAILPFLLFAANENNDPIKLNLSGGTNVSFSLSWEYLSQVLLPTLKTKFGVTVHGKLERRGWSMGPASRGMISLEIQPIELGGQLKPNLPDRNYNIPQDFEIKDVDVSIIVPSQLLKEMEDVLSSDISTLFPGAVIDFVVVEDSGHDSRIYVLLVARSQTGLLWGRDILFNQSRKGKSNTVLAKLVSRKVCRDLHQEVSKRNIADEFLEDQLIVFQALAKGQTRLSGEESLQVSKSDLRQGANDAQMIDKLRKENANEPFGQGSTHAQTARWVTAELLPKIKWFNKGSICEGVGVIMQ